MVFFRIGDDALADELQALPPAVGNPAAWASSGMLAVNGVSLELTTPDRAEPRLVMDSEPNEPTGDDAVDPKAADAPPPSTGKTHEPAAHRFRLDTFVSSTIASATTFLAEWYGTSSDVFSPAVLLDRVAFNATDLDEALDGIMREVEGLGSELISWVDDLQMPTWAVTVIAIAASGAGGAFARRCSGRRPSDETGFEDSSSWLFARLQDPTES
jgi:hypothetical protein